MMYYEKEAPAVALSNVISSGHEDLLCGSAAPDIILSCFVFRCICWIIVERLLRYQIFVNPVGYILVVPRRRMDFIIDIYRTCRHTWHECLETGEVQGRRSLTLCTLQTLFSGFFGQSFLSVICFLNRVGSLWCDHCGRRSAKADQDTTNPGAASSPEGRSSAAVTLNDGAPVKGPPSIAIGRGRREVG